MLLFLLSVGLELGDGHVKNFWRLLHRLGCSVAYFISFLVSGLLLLCYHYEMHPCLLTSH